eukprot:m.529514 g.529514  ORF g.529514 m.529514 type:complete len:163 (+) comp57563_c0_seq70:1854-2342(+)
MLLSINRWRASRESLQQMERERFLSALRVFLSSPFPSFYPDLAREKYVYIEWVSLFFLIGGLNGRPEKLPDVCYSWWVVASLSTIGRVHWLNTDKLAAFILACQDQETGGFADRPGDLPDPFHTLFGITALSLLKFPRLKKVNSIFCMSQETIARVLPELAL